jgi:hypothetical protein
VELVEWGDAVRDLVGAKGVVPARLVRVAWRALYLDSQDCAALRVQHTKLVGMRVCGIVKLEHSVSSGGDAEGS